MDREMARQFIRCLCCALALCLAAGCQREDTRDFQTFSQKRESGSEFPTSFPNEDAFQDDQPLLAELQPDPHELSAEAELPVDALAPVNLVDSTQVGNILRVSPAGDAAQSKLAATSAGQSPDGNQPAAPRKIELLVKSRDFLPEGTEKALRVNFDDLDLLKVLNMDPVTPDAVELMPDWLKHLDGRTIRLRGFMFPTFESTGIEQFVLARDAEKCCFGPNAKVYDLIAVSMKTGKTCDYIHLRPFDVVGTLRIDLQAEDDLVLGLYRIEDAVIVQK